MKAKTRPAFTLVELLTVIAIIGLLISILLPSLGRAREMAHQTACLANQSIIMKGVQVYAKDYDGKLPNWGQRDPGFLSVGMNWDMSHDALVTAGLNGPAVAGSVHSNPRNWYILIRKKLADPKNFICASDSEAVEPFNPADPLLAHDFQYRGQLSFSLQYQGPAFSTTGTAAADVTTGWQTMMQDDPRTVVSADKSPLLRPSQPIAVPAIAVGYDYQIPTGTGTDVYDQFCQVLLGIETTAAITTGKFNHGLARPDDVQSLNSQNHRGEGQNIIRLDGSGTFAQNPWQGAANDNIYTVQDSRANRIDSTVVRDSLISRVCGAYPTGANSATTEVLMLQAWMAKVRYNKTSYPDSFLVP